MRRKIYDFLVNRQPGICYRYHKVHDEAKGLGVIWSWIYLLLLNFGYYVLRMRFLGRKPEAEVYEQKKLITSGCESGLTEDSIKSVDDMVELLAGYDVVSFDIFDTLVFRPFSSPTDLFYVVGDRLAFMDFKGMRTKLEQRARQLEYKRSGSYEVGIEAIWELIERESGIDKTVGITTEVECEVEYCYANPYMKQVYDRLLGMGKQIIIVSDMYLNRGYMEKILDKCGYKGYNELFVSCDYGVNKYGGGLYEKVKACVSGRMVHVGDNPVSDVKSAKAAGIDSVYYPNVNSTGKEYRAYDMSPVIGGAYRGIVNNYLHCGNRADSVEYEYGFVYGGLLVTGYCSYIHKYVRANGIDKVLFLARDGDILMQVYNLLYPEDATEYVYWSRGVSTKLMFNWNRYDYFRRFLYHKVNQGKKIDNVLRSMELESLIGMLPAGLKAQDNLTSGNVEALKEFLIEKAAAISEVYKDSLDAAKAYIGSKIDGCQKVVAVDIGWAGSGALSLDYLVNRVWDMKCPVIGMVMGTNTVHNAEPYASESFYRSGKLESYVFSFGKNTDIMKKHDPNKNYNVYLELLLSSPTRQFRDFAWEKDGSVRLVFGDYDRNCEGIRHIQTGIMDFSKEYLRCFGAEKMFWDIEGRDAYAPIVVAAAGNERYLKMINKRFALEINVS